MEIKLVFGVVAWVGAERRRRHEMRRRRRRQRQRKWARQALLDRFSRQAIIAAVAVHRNTSRPPMATKPTNAKSKVRAARPKAKGCKGYNYNCYRDYELLPHGHRPPTAAAVSRAKRWLSLGQCYCQVESRFIAKIVHEPETQCGARPSWPRRRGMPASAAVAKKNRRSLHILLQNVNTHELACSDPILRRWRHFSFSRKYVRNIPEKRRYQRQGRKLCAGWSFAVDRDRTVIKVVDI